MPMTHWSCIFPNECTNPNNPDKSKRVCLLGVGLSDSLDRVNKLEIFYHLIGHSRKSLLIGFDRFFHWLYSCPYWIDDEWFYLLDISLMISFNDSMRFLSIRKFKNVSAKYNTAETRLYIFRKIASVLPPRLRRVERRPQKTLSHRFYLPNVVVRVHDSIFRACKCDCKTILWVRGPAKEGGWYSCTDMNADEHIDLIPCIRRFYRLPKAKFKNIFSWCWSTYAWLSSTLDNAFIFSISWCDLLFQASISDYRIACEHYSQSAHTFEYFWTSANLNECIAIERFWLISIHVQERI
jgi:hypothetical protein